MPTLRSSNPASTTGHQFRADKAVDAERALGDACSHISEVARDLCKTRNNGVASDWEAMLIEIDDLILRVKRLAR